MMSLKKNNLISKLEADLSKSFEKDSKIDQISNILIEKQKRNRKFEKQSNFRSISFNRKR